MTRPEHYYNYNDKEIFSIFSSVFKDIRKSFSIACKKVVS